MNKITPGSARQFLNDLELPPSLKRGFEAVEEASLITGPRYLTGITPTSKCLKTPGGLSWTRGLHPMRKALTDSKPTRPYSKLPPMPRISSPRCRILGKQPPNQ
jgi:hypothetical protein